jgi:hypothetical protein
MEEVGPSDPVGLPGVGPFSSSGPRGGRMARVEQSLYQRAVGYSFKSEKVFCNKDGEVTRVPIEGTSLSYKNLTEGGGTGCQRA